MVAFTDEELVSELRRRGYIVRREPMYEQAQEWSGPNFKTRNPAINQMLDARQWREHVLKRAHGRCYHCGSQSNLAAHHLIFKSHCHRSFHNDVRNGIALCRHSCHTDLHEGRIKLDHKRLPSDTIELCHTLGLRFTDTGPEGTLANYFKETP